MNHNYSHNDHTNRNNKIILRTQSQSQSQSVTVTVTVAIITIITIDGRALHVALRRDGCLRAHLRAQLGARRQGGGPARRGRGVRLNLYIIYI